MSETKDIRTGTEVRARKAPPHKLVAAACVAFVAAMVGMAYASVPLYAMFCSLTGFGGAPRVSAELPQGTSERLVTVRFDANVAPGLPWVFKPEQPSVTLKVGETKLVYFRAENTFDRPTHGQATFNVTPGNSGFYFVKMQCFCFNEQELKARETLEMPVVFYIDPAIEQDPDMASVKNITLSYTFFPAKPSAAKAAAVGDGAGKGG